MVFKRLNQVRPRVVGAALGRELDSGRVVLVQVGRNGLEVLEWRGRWAPREPSGTLGAQQLGRWLRARRALDPRAVRLALFPLRVGRLACAVAAGSRIAWAGLDGDPPLRALSPPRGRGWRPPVVVAGGFSSVHGTGLLQVTAGGAGTTWEMGRAPRMIASTPFWIKGMADTPRGLFATSSGGKLLRLAGGSWELLDPLKSMRPIQPRSLVWDARRRGLCAIGFDSKLLTRFRGAWVYSSPARFLPRRPFDALLASDRGGLVGAAATPASVLILKRQPGRHALSVVADRWEVPLGRFNSLVSVGGVPVAVNHSELEARILAERGWKPWPLAGSLLESRSFDDRSLCFGGSLDALWMLGADGSLWRAPLSGNLERVADPGGPDPRRGQEYSLAWDEVGERLVVIGSRGAATFVFERGSFRALRPGSRSAAPVSVCSSPRGVLLLGRQGEVWRLVGDSWRLEPVRGERGSRILYDPVEDRPWCLGGDHLGPLGRRAERVPLPFRAGRAGSGLPNATAVADPSRGRLVVLDFEAGGLFALRLERTRA